MNYLGNAKFMLGEYEFEIRFIPQGVKEFFSLESVDEDGQIDAFKLNRLCLCFALVGYGARDGLSYKQMDGDIKGTRPVTETRKIPGGGEFSKMWSEAWYSAMPTSIIEGIQDHIFAHNSFSAEKVAGLNFI